MIKHNFRSAIITCTLINTVTGDTKEEVFTVPHPIKVFNERTKTRVLKEITNNHMTAGLKDFKPIFAKSYENKEVVVTMSEEDFLKYGKIVPEYADTDTIPCDLNE